MRKQAIDALDGLARRLREDQAIMREQSAEIRRILAITERRQKRRARDLNDPLPP